MKHEGEEFPIYKRGFLILSDPSLELYMEEIRGFPNFSSGHTAQNTPANFETCLVLAIPRYQAFRDP